jgi:hypothetical protein
LPELPGSFDIRRLSSFLARIKKNNNAIAVPAVVNPVAGTSTKFKFVNAAAKILGVTPKPAANSHKSRIDHHLDIRVQ